jgi:hypothetical protein
LSENRFGRPTNGRIPYLPPYTEEVAEASRVLGDRSVAGSPARGIRDVTVPYTGTVIAPSGPVSIIGRNGEKVSDS